MNTEQIIQNFSNFLREKATKLEGIPEEIRAVISRTEAKDFILDEIYDFTELDEWSPDDLAYISSLFFWLLVSHTPEPIQTPKVIA